MKNIFVIAMVVVAIGYMFVIMFEKYDNAVKVDEKLKQQQSVQIQQNQTSSTPQTNK
jgi:short subunit fatty acids transporter